MGEGELIPFPIVRCPCRRRAGARHHCLACIREVVGWDTYEVPAAIRVKTSVFARIRLVLTSLFFAAYLFYQACFWKGYLTTEAIQGVSRLQLQHPSLCNPLKQGCNEVMRDFSQMRYCQQYPGPDRSLHAFPCQHFDEFEILYKGQSQENLMVPTRITRIDQKMLCDGMNSSCSQKYANTKVSTVYVADIENWTVLVDHSFICEQLGIAMAAFDMQGFFAPCLEAGDSVLTSRPVSHGEPQDCSKLPIRRSAHLAQKCQTIDCPVGTALTAKEVAFWAPEYDETKDGEVARAFKEISAGDVIKLGDLLHALGVDLDAPLVEGAHPNSTYRIEGLVIVLEIEYLNFRRVQLSIMNWMHQIWKWNLPHSLPPVYVYRFKIAPTGEYKTMQAHIDPRDPSGSSRIIEDRHGIYIIVKQMGTMGKWSPREILWMLIEFAILIGLVRYVTTMVAMNWHEEEGFNKFEEKYCPTVKLKNGEPYEIYPSPPRSESEDDEDYMEEGERGRVISRRSF